MVVAGDRFGQDTQLPKICRAGAAVDRPHPAAADRRANGGRAGRRRAGHRARRPRGLPGPFARQSSIATRLKVMTDGVLLAEIARDRDLRRYDTIILDEAHERSLNIDFLLGYLRRLLPRRPDLKVLITSATIDTERFAAHFAGRTAHRLRWSRCPGGPTRSRSATGRRRWSPEVDQVAAVLDGPSCGTVGDGDILVFLSGEREIRTWPRPCTAPGCRAPRCCRCTPDLRPPQHGSSRRTPVAGSCWPPMWPRPLTVPGIRYVIDPGTAGSRAGLGVTPCSGYRSTISRLAAQRAGRCGRVALGVCIRLYSEDDCSKPPGVHRAGDPADQPGVGDPADGRRPAQGDRRLPRRAPIAPRWPTGCGCSPSWGRWPTLAFDQPRLTAVSSGWPHCRWTRGWAGWSRRNARVACGRC